jgi:hypothetical protein
MKCYDLKKLLCLRGSISRYCTSHEIDGSFSGHHCSLGRRLIRVCGIGEIQLGFWIILLSSKTRSILGIVG